MTQPIPDGYTAVTPYLCVKGAAQALDFYKRAFGAKEIMRMAMSDDRVGHAEIEIGGARVMLADEFPEMGFRSPRAIGGTPVQIHLYVKDVDAVFPRAIAAGAKEKRPLRDEFYGDRTATLEDPYGHVWTVSTHKEDVSPEEMERRLSAMSAQGS
jgi:PhnB protein